jgi:hypothetical protein
MGLFASFNIATQGFASLRPGLLNLGALGLAGDSAAEEPTLGANQISIPHVPFVEFNFVPAK